MSHTMNTGSLNHWKDPLSTTKHTRSSARLGENKLRRCFPPHSLLTRTLFVTNFLTAFQVTFKDNLHSTAFLNALSYIHRVFSVVTKGGSLYVTAVTTVLKFWMCLQCLNLLRKKVDENNMSVNINYRTGNIICLIVKRMVHLFTPLLRRVVSYARENYLLLYMWYNTVTGMYGTRMIHDGFVLLRHRNTLLPSVRSVRSDTDGVHESYSWRDGQNDYGMCYIGNIFAKAKENCPQQCDVQITALNWLSLASIAFACPCTLWWPLTSRLRGNGRCCYDYVEHRKYYSTSALSSYLGGCLYHSFLSRNSSSINSTLYDHHVWCIISKCMASFNEALTYLTNRKAFITSKDIFHGGSWSP